MAVVYHFFHTLAAKNAKKREEKRGSFFSVIFVNSVVIFFLRLSPLLAENCDGFGGGFRCTQVLDFLLE
jgi:hypothetical protein